MRNPFKFYRSDYEYSVFYAYNHNNENIINRSTQSGESLSQDSGDYEWTHDGTWRDAGVVGQHSYSVQRFIDTYRSKKGRNGEIAGARLVRRHKKKKTIETVAEFYRMDGTDTQGWVHQKLYHEHRDMCYQLNWTIMFKEAKDEKSGTIVSKDVPPRKVVVME